MSDSTDFQCSKMFQLNIVDILQSALQYGTDFHCLSGPSYGSHTIEVQFAILCFAAS